MNQVFQSISMQITGADVPREDGVSRVRLVPPRIQYLTPQTAHGGTDY